MRLLYLFLVTFIIILTAAPVGADYIVVPVNAPDEAQETSGPSPQPSPQPTPSPAADLTTYQPSLVWEDQPKAKPWISQDSPDHWGRCSTYPADGWGWSTPLSWPTASRYVRSTRLFGEGGHYAIDIDTPQKSPVAAAASGLVVWSGYYGGGLGQMVVLAHGGGWQTFYGHLYSIKVSCGQYVAKGSLIGYSGGGKADFPGQFGLSTFPALHFEVRNHGRAGDPLRWLLNTEV